MTPIQRLAHNLHTALMTLLIDDAQDDCGSIWAWFGSERVYEYSTTTGKELDSFYNGAWSNNKPTAKEVREYTRLHIDLLQEEKNL